MWAVECCAYIPADLSEIFNTTKNPGSKSKNQKLGNLENNLIPALTDSLDWGWDLFPWCNMCTWLSWLRSRPQIELWQVIHSNFVLSIGCAGDIWGANYLYILLYILFTFNFIYLDVNVDIDINKDIDTHIHIHIHHMKKWQGLDYRSLGQVQYISIQK